MVSKSWCEIVMLKLSGYTNFIYNFTQTVTDEYSLVNIEITVIRYSISINIDKVDIDR